MTAPAEHAAGLWPKRRASLSNFLGADHYEYPPPSQASADDVSRVEELDENPNPQAAIELRDRSIWISTSDSRTEPYPAKPTTPSPAIYHPFSVHVLALLMSFSVLGTLARLGIHALTSYEGQSIFSLAWVQAVGCGIMGFAFGLREPITRFYGPLYTAITTGFCGSLTTFSGWQLDVFQAWDNASGFRRLWIYTVMDGLTRTLFTFAASLASFGLGVHLGVRIASRVPILSPPSSFMRWTLTIFSSVLYILTIPVFVWLNHTWRPLATAALVFSFPGTLTRYYLSTLLNSRIKALPLGTLIANEVAVALLAAFHIIQRMPSSPPPLPCSILQGFIDGYCGCMSTVSTFISEIRMLQGRKAWVYAVISVLLGQILLLVMLGPALWTGRIKENNVCHFV